MVPIQNRVRLLQPFAHPRRRACVRRTIIISEKRRTEEKNNYVWKSPRRFLNQLFLGGFFTHVTVIYTIIFLSHRFVYNIFYFTAVGRRACTELED